MNRLIQCDSSSSRPRSTGSKDKLVNHTASVLAFVSLFASGAAWAQTQPLVLQVPVRVSGITDATVTHVHLQCVVEGSSVPGAGPRTWGAAATRLPMVRGVLDTTVNMTVAPAPGGFGDPVSYRCFMGFARGEASFDFVSPASLGGGTVVNEVTGRL
jgi:hypothetical protein